MRQFATGTVVGTGAAINVNLGWQPDYIEVANITDGNIIDRWYAGMAPGTSMTSSAGVAPRAANGLSLFAGDTASAKGFTIGSGISTAGKTLAYIAQRV